jgi:hypothetical protein
VLIIQILVRFRSGSFAQVKIVVRTGWRVVLNCEYGASKFPEIQTWNAA